MKKIIVVSIVLLLILPMGLFAGDDGLLEIGQVPQVDFKEKPAGPSIGEYNGKGQIDSISKDMIVINDLDFSLSSKLRTTAINGLPYNGPLKKGLIVYYFLDADKAIVKMIVDPKK